MVDNSGGSHRSGPSVTDAANLGLVRPPIVYLGALALFNAAFSPDGRWVAYTQRIQTPAIWVASVRAPDTRYKVGQKSDLAHKPMWSPDGSRLF